MAHGRPSSGGGFFKFDLSTEIVEKKLTKGYHNFILQILKDKRNGGKKVTYALGQDVSCPGAHCSAHEYPSSKETRFF
jgi:hypothetical protein